MSFKSFFIAISFSLFIITNGIAQKIPTVTKQELSLDKSIISNQFEYVIQKSTNWTDPKGQNYEVVRKQWIEQLKANTLDSLKGITNKHTLALKTITEQTREIKNLKSKSQNIQTNLNTLNAEKDQISLFGILMSKASYNNILFSIIAILLGLLGFFIYQFKNSNILTKKAKHELLEVESEFEEYRRKALEREQKVRRKLQDEINKHKNKS